MAAMGPFEQLIGATGAEETKEGSESEADHAKEKEGSDSEVANPADRCVDCNLAKKEYPQAWHMKKEWI